MRVWNPGATAPDGRPRVVLPGLGRPDSEFAAEIGALVAPRECWFAKGDDVVRVAMREFSEEVRQLAFNPVEPVSACTDVEQYVEAGITQKDDASGDTVFIPCSMTPRNCRQNAIRAAVHRPDSEDRSHPRRVRSRSENRAGSSSRSPATIRRCRTWMPEDAPCVRPMPFAGRHRPAPRDLLRVLLGRQTEPRPRHRPHHHARICRGLMGWHARTPLWYLPGQPARRGQGLLRRRGACALHRQPHRGRPLWARTARKSANASPRS